MANRCSVSEVEDRADWDALFSGVVHPDMMQSWGYGEARRAAGTHGKSRSQVRDLGGWRPRRLCIERDGEAVAACQLFDKTVAGVRVASRLYHGPAFLGDELDPAAVRDVFATLRRLWHLKGRVLVLAPALSDDPQYYVLFQGLGFRDRRVPGFESSRLDLRRDEEWLFMNLRPTWRNRLRVSLRSGLELEVGNSDDMLEWMIERHEENMAVKGFIGPSGALLRALHGAARDDLVIYRALLDGEPMGGMLAFGFGTTATYYVGWMALTGRDVCVSNFLYWHAALDLKSRGYRWFDLGGERVNATALFKRGMHGEKYAYLNEWLSY